jgi:hypothetical protein
MRTPDFKDKNTGAPSGSPAGYGHPNFLRQKPSPCHSQLCTSVPGIVEDTLCCSLQGVGHKANTRGQERLAPPLPSLDAHLPPSLLPSPQGHLTAGGPQRTSEAWKVFGGEKVHASRLQAPGPGKTLPLLLPGVWDAADDGAEHEGCDKGEEGQVDEALHTIIAEACQSLHVVLSRKKGHKRGGRERIGDRQ